MAERKLLAGRAAPKAKSSCNCTGNFAGNLHSAVVRRFGVCVGTEYADSRCGYTGGVGEKPDADTVDQMGLKRRQRYVL